MDRANRVLTQGSDVTSRAVPRRAWASLEEFLESDEDDAMRSRAHRRARNCSVSHATSVHTLPQESRDVRVNGSRYAVPNMGGLRRGVINLPDHLQRDHGLAIVTNITSSHSPELSPRFAPAPRSVLQSGSVSDSATPSTPSVALSEKSVFNSAIPLLSKSCQVTLAESSGDNPFAHFQRIIATLEKQRQNLQAELEQTTSELQQLASALQNDLNSCDAENQRLRDALNAASLHGKDNACVICLQAQASHALVPCGHLVLCEACSRTVDKCPLCRAKSEGMLRIFQA